MVDSREIRLLAFRDFVVAFAVLSAFAGTGLFFYVSTPVLPEPWKSGLAVFIALSWISGGVGLVANLRRDLTPSSLTEVGLVLGRRVIPYTNIQRIDRRPGRRRFGVEQRTPRREVVLSKIGIESEDVFFEELGRRISGGQRST